MVAAGLLGHRGRAMLTQGLHNPMIVHPLQEPRRISADVLRRNGSVSSLMSASDHCDCETTLWASLAPQLLKTPSLNLEPKH